MKSRPGIERSRIVLLLTIAALGGLIFAIRPSGPAPSSSGASKAGPNEVWPAGLEQRFDLDWKTRSRGALAHRTDPRALLESQVELAGVLRVQSHGERDGATVLVARLERIDRVNVRAAGRDLFASPEEAARDLTARDALLLLDKDGSVKDVRFVAGSPALFRTMMRAVLIELAAQAAWAHPLSPSSQQTSLGRARVLPVRDAKDPLRVTTTRTSYHELEAYADGLPDDATQALTARAEITLDPDGAFHAATLTEELAVEGGDGILSAFGSTTTLTFTSREKKRVAAAPLPDFPEGIPRPSVAGDPAARRATLEQRGAGVTRASVVADARLFALLPQAGDTSWITRDAAWLELHPEECEALAVTAGKELDLAGRAAVFDLIVIAGTPRAQAALRAALATWAAADATAYSILIQRLGHLAVPTKETVDFVVAEYERHKKVTTEREYFLAVAYTLGAVVASFSNDDPEGARKIADRMVLDLHAARRADDRIALLRGLGNAGLDEDAHAFMPYAADTDAEVRLAVAAALRKMDSGPSNRALLALAGDKGLSVARTAISSLLRHALDGAEWTALSALVTEGRLAPDAETTLVNELVLHGERRLEGDAVLIALLAKESTDPSLKLRIESVLRPAVTAAAAPP